MRKNIFNALIVGWIMCVTAAADVVIDSFTIDQVMNGAGTQNTVFDFSMGTILGRERDAADNTEFGAAEVTGGNLVITGSPDAVVFLVLQWDGFDADNIVLNTTGINPPADLTEGGENNMVEFGFAQLELGNSPILMTVVAFSGSGNFSVASVNLTKDIPSPGSINLPFADFFTIGGSGVDFSSVTAIEITIEVDEEAGLVDPGVRARGPGPSNLNLVMNFINAAIGADANLSATKVDEVINETIVDGIANPGETIRYTITVTNAGPDGISAANFADLLPPGTTLVPGSIQTSPIARDDFFATPPATPVSISAPGVLGNDNDPDGQPLVIDSFEPLSANGDAIALNPDGSFDYTPSATGGTDTFAYAISDGVFTNEALVSIVIDSVAELSVTLTDDMDPVTAGAFVTFTTIVTNTGPSTAQTVRIVHEFPPGMDFQMASPGPGVTCSNPAPGVVACEIANLDIGATAQVDLLTQAIGSGFQTSRVTVSTTTFENDTSDNTAEEVTFIDTPPVALDSLPINVFGNTLRSVPAPGVLLGAFDPEGQPISLLTTTTNSANGGSVTIQPDGSFEYLPPAGFTGPSDTFDFIITDGLGTDVGSVGLIINEMIWYVDNSLGVNGDGTSENPFNTLANVNGATDADAPGEFIFLFEGSGAYTGGLALEDDQSLIGQGVDLIVTSSNLVSATARPLLEDGLTLAQNNLVRGLDIGSNATGNMLFGLNFASLTLDNAQISGLGGVVLDTGDLTVALDHLVSSNATLHGIQLQSLTGTLDVTGSTTATDPTLAGILLNNSPGFASSFGDTLVTDSGGASPATGVSLGNDAGASTTFNSLNITTENGLGFAASTAGTINIVNQPATIDATGGGAIIISDTAGQSGGAAGWTFDTVMSTGSSGTGISLASLTDTFTVTGQTMLGSPTGNGIDIAASPGVTFDFASVTITGGGADGIVADTSAGANLSLGELVGDMNGNGFVADGLNNVQVLNPVLNSLFVSDGVAVDLTNIANVNAEFGEAIVENTAGPGIEINNVIGTTTFEFIEVITTGGNGINLQNAGTVNVRDAFSSISSTAGVALNADNTVLTMDMGMITAEGGVNGITLNGVSGAMNVFDFTTITSTTGAGIDIANSGGGTFTFGNLVIDNSLSNQPGLIATTGGNIGNNAGPGSTIDSGSAAAVEIDNSVVALTFDRIDSVGGLNPGIDLDTITGSFTVTGDGIDTTRGGNASGGQINGKIGDAVVLNDVENVTLRRMELDNAGGRAMQLNDATDTVLEYCSLDNSVSHGIEGTRNLNLTLTDCAFIGNGSLIGDDTIRFAGTNPDAGLAGTFSLTGSLISNYPENAVEVQNHSGALSATIDNCTIDDNNDVFGSDAVFFVSAGTGTINLDVLNSTFDDSEGSIVRFEADGTTNNDLNIQDNDSNNGGGPNDFPLAGGSIALITDNVGAFTFDIQRNNLTELPGFGILIEGDGNVEGRIGNQALADANTILTRNGTGAGDAIILNKGGETATPALNNTTWTILVQNNTLGDDGVSGAGNGDGIAALHRDDNGVFNLSIEDNTIQNITLQGIDIFSDEESASVITPISNMRIVNNTFVGLNNDAIEIDVDDTARVCAHIQGNQDAGGGSPGVFDLNRNHVDARLQITQLNIPSLTAANNTATVNTTGTITFDGGCFNPSVPTNP